MTDTMTAVKQANSTIFLPETTDDMVSLPVGRGSDGDIVCINGHDIPLLDEDFRLSVVQPGSVKTDKALQKHIGRIRLHFGEDTEEDRFYDELYLVPISVLGYSFAKFDKFDGKATSPVCSSQNGQFPAVRNDVTPVSRQCAKFEIVKGEPRIVPVCPAAIWGDDGEKPTCQMNVRVAFLTLPDCIPVTMQLHGLGLSAFNALLRQRRKAFNVARIKKRDISRFAVKLFTENMGTYVATKFLFVEAPSEYGPVSEYTPVARHFRDTLFAVKAAEKPADYAEETEDDAEAIVI